jgi:hypothetical protein
MSCGCLSDRRDEALEAGDVSINIHVSRGEYIKRRDVDCLPPHTVTHSLVGVV